MESIHQLAKYAKKILFCEAHTFGKISQNKRINAVMAVAFKINSTQNKLCRRLSASSIKKLVRKIKQRLNTTLADIKLAISTFGSSSKFTMRLAGASGLVLIMLRSLYRNEKKATSAPLTTNEKNNNSKNKITSKVNPWLLIAKRTGLIESKNEVLTW